MKKYIAVLTATNASKEVLIINANSRDEAFRLAVILADDLADDDFFAGSDEVDVDVYGLGDLPEISPEDDSFSSCGDACARALSKIIRLIRDSEGALPDEAAAKILLDAMVSPDEE